MHQTRLLLATAAVAAALTACGSTTHPDAAHPAAAASSSTPANKLAGLVLDPSEQAPPLSLHNYTGTPVTLAGLRGKAVFVTFVYTECKNVCPLIMASLASADRMLGAEASHVAMVAVTVDPRHDTPTAIHTYLAARGAVGRIDYLLGTLPQLERTWRAWDVAVTVDRSHVTTGHTAIVYGINAKGRVLVVFPANFTPGEVVHDVPLLARA